ENNEYDTGQDDRKMFTQIVGRRLARAGKFAEARPYLDPEAQKTLDEYLYLVKKGSDAHSSKADRAKALWDAAQLIDENGDSIFDYSMPDVMGGRLTGREVKEPDAPSAPSQIAYGDLVKFVPPITPTEKARLK